jgi:aspartyl-tRNA(Asn)/glutamyl-tRNA(Gln) amidotransferase subunit C
MIEKKDVAYVAHLARLSLTEQETEEMAGQLGSILQYVDHLGKADTAGVEPTAFVAPRHDSQRDDIVTPSLDKNAALGNGPSVKKGFFAVPKVIKQ